MTSDLPFCKAARQVSSMLSAWLKSIATSQFLIAGSIESPKSHCATISISASLRAISSTVFPMRPAAPMSSTRTGELFIFAEPSLYALPLEGRGDWIAQLDAPLPEGERIKGEGLAHDIHLCRWNS